MYVSFSRLSIRYKGQTSVNERIIGYIEKKPQNNTILTICAGPGVVTRDAGAVKLERSNSTKSSRYYIEIELTFITSLLSFDWSRDGVDRDLP